MKSTSEGLEITILLWITNTQEGYISFLTNTIQRFDFLPAEKSDKIKSIHCRCINTEFCLQCSFHKSMKIITCANPICKCFGRMQFFNNVTKVSAIPQSSSIQISKTSSFHCTKMLREFQFKANKKFQAS